MKLFKTTSFYKLVMLGGVVTAAIMFSTLFSANETSFVRDVTAAQGEGGRGAGGPGDGTGQGKRGDGEARGGERGSGVERDVFRDEAEEDSDRPEWAGTRGPHGDEAGEDEEDSDRPEWAGTPGKEGKPGGGSAGGDTKKGGDYGDLFVILRDDTGAPILDANGNVQPCLDAGCSEYIQLVDGEIPPEYVDQLIEADFGRLNVSRAPSKVLDHSLTELLAKLDGAEITLANLDDMTDESGRLIDLLGNTIDSPLENLAFYQALLEATATTPVDGFYTLSVTADQEGSSVELDLKVSVDVLPILAASAISAASDKYGSLIVDDIVYISGFLGVDDELANLVSSYTYDRTALFDEQIWILEPVVIDGTTYYQPTLVNVLDEVTFNDVPAIDGDNDGIDIFTQNADDAVQVLEFVHDNAIEPPATP